MSQQNQNGFKGENSSYREIKFYWAIGDDAATVWRVYALSIGEDQATGANAPLPAPFILAALLGGVKAGLLADRCTGWVDQLRSAVQCWNNQN